MSDWPRDRSGCLRGSATGRGAIRSILFPSNANRSLDLIHGNIPPNNLAPLQNLARSILPHLRGQLANIGHGISPLLIAQFAQLLTSQCTRHLRRTKGLGRLSLVQEIGEMSCQRHLWNANYCVQDQKQSMAAAEWVVGGCCATARRCTFRLMEIGFIYFIQLRKWPSARLKRWCASSRGDRRRERSFDSIPSSRIHLSQRLMQEMEPTSAR
ncbi:hypothetical protein BDY17DRAFT_185800 [Neohortaea acidophila]|uniref:Uncharacterized protein n=1 Tax=Neohortaea acidophila TaxID=245834 RepID=A0A6A6PNK8_9PEZI|nr:uncharacterized protein BDY17DRAFT_185800 [Neohortaea acidophila]KAF2481281.1 hypothetical protein BDY17DRAFT_185800 [Neohortaea acidophila]